MRLSAIVLTGNEKGNIEDCIGSLRFCNEVLVIDDFSKDKTVGIAQKLGAKVYKRSLNNNFASQRNFGLTRARGEWVLFVDADERISKKLSKEILKAIKDEGVNGYFLKRLDFFKGKALKHGETSSIRLLRLGRRISGEWTRGVHETWHIEGKAGNLKNPIFHYPHKTITDFIKNINYFSSLHADENNKEKKNSSMLKIICFPIIKFVRNWVFNLGFLDGVHGFVNSASMSFHSFLSWSKLWLIQKKG